MSFPYASIAQFIPMAVWKRKRFPLYNVIQSVGLSTDLSCVLDFGDSRCYSGSGNNIYNIVNPSEIWTRNGGLPFHGASGGLSASEYFQGNDSGYLKANSMTTWDDQWNRSNSKFSCFAIVRWGGSDTTSNWLKLISNSALGASRGTAIAVMGQFSGYGNSNSTLAVVESNSSSYLSWWLDEGVMTVPKNQWCAVGVAVDTAANTIRYMINRNSFLVNFPTGVWASPLWNSNESSNPPENPTIMAWGSGSYPSGSAHRVGCLSFWNGRVLTQAEFFSIYDKMKFRYGLS